MRKSTLLLASFLVFTSFLFAQQPAKVSASNIHESIKKLNFLGTALLIAAHPDDEDTRLISYMANTVKARMAYLSLTRGDGGQNLIGPEIRELLGVIRTQELLAARRTDGGEQFFTRANDFGYSKHPTETLKIWDKKQVLSDVVRVIRNYKPDIIINGPDHRRPGSNHGHHTAAAMLGFEAFDLVGDAKAYPEHLEEGIKPWQVKRIFFNSNWRRFGNREEFEKSDKSNLVQMESGTFYPATGLSNGEISALSRSMHKSQGFGMIGTRGNRIHYLELLKGDKLKDMSNPFDGINTTWTRIKGGKAIGDILHKVETEFNFNKPGASVPELLKAYQLILNLEDQHWRVQKIKEIKAIIAQCAGLFLEARANNPYAVKGGSVKINIEAINRSSLNIALKEINFKGFDKKENPNTTLENNKVYQLENDYNLLESLNLTSPYWLNEKGSLGMYKVNNKALIGMPEAPAEIQITFALTINNVPIEFSRNLIYKFRDPVKGEVYRPFEILPEVTASIAEKVIIFSDNQVKNIPVTVKSGRNNLSGSISLEHPKGWKIAPENHNFTFANKDQEQTFIFKVTPPENQDQGYLRSQIKVGNKTYNKALITIDYDHIPFQSVLMPSETKIVRLNIEKRGQHIGYINGAGDAIPESLKQIGYQVTSIEPSDISLEKLVNFDAIVLGIRAYNIVDELKFKQPILLDYVKNGGTLLIQYNTSRRLKTDNLAPYALKLSRERVTDEFAKVTLLNTEHQALNFPNKITEKDFDGWVQERGLYFPGQWDEKAFTPLLEMNDQGAKPSKGSLLVAAYGKGYYIYTGLSFFRELPAGVPGAYRLFANLLSLGKK